MQVFSFSMIIFNLFKMIYCFHLFISPPCISFASPNLLSTHIITCSYVHIIECSNKCGTPTSTNSISFSSNDFLILSLLNKLVFIAICVFLTTFFVFFYAFLPLAHVESLLGFTSPFAKPLVLFGYQQKFYFCLNFLQSECHIHLFLSFPVNHVFETCIAFFMLHASNILHSKFN